MIQGGYISTAMQDYWLDPIVTMNKGLQSYDAQADARLRQAAPLTKLPGTKQAEPTIYQVRHAQTDGPFAFQSPQTVNRQKGSCTKPQMDVMPDRLSTSYHPPRPDVCGSAPSMVIEPFPREGQNARWMAKERTCVP